MYKREKPKRDNCNKRVVFDIIIKYGRDIMEKDVEKTIKKIMRNNGIKINDHPNKGRKYINVVLSDGSKIGLKLTPPRSSHLTELKLDKKTAERKKKEYSSPMPARGNPYLISNKYMTEKELDASIDLLLADNLGF